MRAIREACGIRRWRTSIATTSPSSRSRGPTGRASSPRTPELPWRARPPSRPSGRTPPSGRVTPPIGSSTSGPSMAGSSLWMRPPAVLVRNSVAGGLVFIGATRDNHLRGLRHRDQPAALESPFACRGPVDAHDLRDRRQAVVLIAAGMASLEPPWATMWWPSPCPGQGSNTDG
jgi:hypothetical protein